MRTSIIQHYKNERFEMYGVSFGLPIRDRIMWVEMPILLMRPVEFFFLTLKPATSRPTSETSAGDISFPEYVHYPLSGGLLGSSCCMIDYFTGVNMDGPYALFFSEKGDVYKTPNGLLPLYS